MRVPLADGGYDVLYGRGLLTELPELLDRLCPAAHYAVVSDTTVGPLYAEAVAAAIGARSPVSVAAFPTGEWNKTRDTWASLTDRLLAAGLGRDGAVVAIGGGVVGDVAGFVAATYMRGIPYVQVPTTLLAMIDSAIGGKTGVDTPAGKNLVGAFHQPRAVVADITTLATLPRNQLAAGMAEAVKHGAIADAAYFGRLQQLAPAVLRADVTALDEVVAGSVPIKAELVAGDERERGKRAVLNFGHTVAHALEAGSGYELLHGEAVAIGMVVEAKLGQRLGLTASEAPRALENLLSALELPTTMPVTLDRNRLMDIMRGDKKVRATSVRFALLQAIGLAYRGDDEWTVAVDEHDIAEALQASDC